MTGLEAQVNAQGGIKGPDGKPHPLRVIMYDDQSQESQTVLVAKRLIQEDKVSVIIGSSQSGTTLAMVDTVQQAQAPLISAAANAGIVQPVANRKWVFKTPQNDELVMSALLDWLTSKSVTKVAWISVNNAFGDGGRTQFDKLASGYALCGRERAVRRRRPGHDRAAHEDQGHRLTGDRRLGVPAGGLDGDPERGRPRDQAPDISEPSGDRYRAARRGGAASSPCGAGNGASRGWGCVGRLDPRSRFHYTDRSADRRENAHPDRERWGIRRSR